MAGMDASVHAWYAVHARQRHATVEHAAAAVQGSPLEKKASGRMRARGARSKEIKTLRRASAWLARKQVSRQAFWLCALACGKVKERGGLVASRGQREKRAEQRAHRRAQLKAADRRRAQLKAADRR
eukprot:1070955-Pleurochrysis_carterae.AAC.1